MNKFPLWSEFEYKYPSEKERQDRLEDVARGLFCKRYDIGYGIFQYVNHMGNETEVIERDGEVIGFQAKYFRKTISKKKLVESIGNAKEDNPTQTKVIIYMNLAFGESTKRKNNTKRTSATKSSDSSVKLSVEKYAEGIGLKVEWVTDKMILDQVARIKWMRDVFFEVNNDYEDLYAFERRNTEELLAPIETNIIYENQPIKVPRTQIIDKLVDGISHHKSYVIHGEGGCGKTAIIKDLFERIRDNKIPVCIRRAQSLNVVRVDEIFRSHKNFTIEQFLEIYQDTDTKVFVIDSAERLQEIDDLGPVFNLLKRLSENGWSVLFTVRDVYYGDLCEDLKITYRLKYETISVDALLDEELEKLAAQLHVLLPDNPDFKSRLCNIFYLGFYLSYYATIRQEESYQSFINHVWHKKVVGNSRRKGIGLDREKCFLHIVRDRMNNSSFYLDKTRYESVPLQELLSDEIIAETDSGIFIAHDIYEEWGVLQIINQEWNRKSSISDFFTRIGSSYVARRTFRQWLTEEFKKDQFHEERNIFMAAIDPTIDSRWRDEIIVSILLSPCSDAFIREIEPILESNSQFFERICYLLVMACNQVGNLGDAQEPNNNIYIPSGRGWEVIVKSIYDHRDSDLYNPYKQKILFDWVLHNPIGITARYVGLTALDTIVKGEESRSRKYDFRSYEGTLFTIVSLAANELRAELTLLLGKIVRNKWNHRDEPYYDFSTFILTQNIRARRIVELFPKAVIKLAEMMWIYDGNANRIMNPYSMFDQFDQFGLHELDGHFSYSLEGAFQTPIYVLLCRQPDETMEFIVRLVNHSIEHYAEHKDTEYREALEKIEMRMPDGSVVEQWGAYWLWGMYRGGDTMAPSLLQCVHMALEKYLLTAIKERPENVEPFCDYILKNSRSVSLTAVVASIVMAYPEKYHKYALTLFTNLELFQYDNIRYREESMNKWGIGLAIMQNREVVNERVESSKLPHRKETLEGICTRYQYYRTELTEIKSKELVEEIHRILDVHWATIPEDAEDEADTKRILLYRLDRRTHDPKVTGEENGLIVLNLNPQLPDDLAQRSQEVIKHSEESFRFSSLHVWAYKKFKREDISQYGQYESDVHVVMKSLRELLEALKNGEDLMPMSDWTPYCVAGVLIRDSFDQLDKVDKELCKQLVVERLLIAMAPSYHPMIDDGTECSVHALPQLIEHDEEDADMYWKMLMQILLNPTPIGQYKRVCDYTIETIHEATMWQTYPQQLRELLKYYIEQTTSKETLERSSFGEQERAEMILSIIPCDTTEDDLVQIAYQQFPAIRYQLTERLYSRYYRNLHLFGAYANFLINRPIDKVDYYLEPLKDAMESSREWHRMLLEIIYAEDRYKKVDTFWKIWELLYPKMVSPKYGYDDSVVSTYLLVNYSAIDNRREWHSFRPQDRWIYSKTSKDIGQVPVVLYSIAKALNGIASEFVHEGIDWVYEIVHKYPSLNLDSLQDDTNLFLQRALNAYTGQNRKSIRRDNVLLNKILEILTFMAERGSIFAYKLRERL